MLNKAIDCRRPFIAIVLFSISPFGLVSFGQSREQKLPSQTSTKKAAVNEKERKDEKRIKQAQSIIQEILFGTHSVLNPVVRIRIRMLVADAYWDTQQEKAREILSEEFPNIALIAAPQNESDFGKLWSTKDSGKPPMYKGRPIEQVKAQLRREMLAIISAGLA